MVRTNGTASCYSRKLSSEFAWFVGLTTGVRKTTLAVEQMSRLPFRNVKTKQRKTIFLTVILHGCETWPLILSEEERLRIFENKALMRTTCSRGIKWQDAGEDCLPSRSTVHTARQILLL